jgi:hypothetical protein
MYKWWYDPTKYGSMWDNFGTYWKVDAFRHWKILENSGREDGFSVANVRLTYRPSSASFKWVCDLKQNGTQQINHVKSSKICGGWRANKSIPH